MQAFRWQKKWTEEQVAPVFLTFGHHHGELFRTALPGDLCPALLKTAEEAPDNESPGNNGKWLQRVVMLLQQPGLPAAEF